MISFFNQQQIEKISSYAFEAGEIAVKAQKAQDFQVRKKPDNSRVTSADIAISDFIYNKLSKEFPEIPIVCEERKLPKVDNVFWLIDPIDGTNSFIDGINEFAINIALIKNKKAVFGLIYGPNFEGGKMIFSDHNNQVNLQKKSGEKKILSFTKSSPATLRIVTSPRTEDSDIKNYVNQFRQNFVTNYTIERLSSALKFLRILENDADLYLHFRKSMEWDTAAGQALIEHSQGFVKTISINQKNIYIEENLRYKKDQFLNQPFITFIR